ncbi:hypothetical protein L7F22_023983 [Adiantum nelumboides]|nr:hypothetical protein [Adiantum nelumboides]
MFVSAASSKPGSGVVNASSAKKSFLVTPFAPKAPHEPEPLWKYVVQTGSFNSGGSKKWNCSFCKADYAGSYSRVRAHLLGIKKQGIGLCLKATSEDKEFMAREEHESSNKKEKESSQLKRKAHGQHSLESMFNASCREEVDEAVARCFYACGLSFTLARSPYFSEMVSAIASFGKGYKAPNYQKLRTTLLANEKGRIERNAITKGKEVQQFITNHDTTRAMFGKHSKLKLVRPGETRFASHFMMLHRLVRVKTTLKHLVTCEEWDIWKSQNMDAKDIEKTILDFEFWDEIQRYVKVCWPVMAMLRMVDRDDACMGVMFEGMDQMVEKIKKILLEEVNGEAMFEEMNVYIQARWLMMDSPLHATAFLLNPKWFPKAPHKDAENSFGESGALEDMEHLSPVAWWENYGEDAPLLQGLAIKLLSQVASASASERNWSTYGFIHSVKRNRLEHQMADDLVYVHSNLRLQSRKEPAYVMGPCKSWDVEEVDDEENAIEEEMEAVIGDNESM